MPAVAVRRKERVFMCVSRCKTWRDGPFCQNVKSKGFFGNSFVAMGLVLKEEIQNLLRKDKI